jgi:hypothetical protein
MIHALLKSRLEEVLSIILSPTSTVMVSPKHFKPLRRLFGASNCSCRGSDSLGWSHLFHPDIFERHSCRNMNIRKRLISDYVWAAQYQTVYSMLPGIHESFEVLFYCQ